MSGEKYEYEPHRFVTHPKLGKSQCVVCGLIALKNDFTKWAIDKGCNNVNHPGFKSQRNKTKAKT